MAFQSTHPLRGATHTAATSGVGMIFQSTHPLRGATRTLRLYFIALLYFNPRTPCGARPASYSLTNSSFGFQSTHPLRGATPGQFYPHSTKTISIHAPLAGCDSPRFCPLTYILRISIHAPLAGCDRPRTTSSRRTKYFNPRTPCGVRQ